MLRRWNYVDSCNCEFELESLTVEGAKIPSAIEEKIDTDLFVPEDFEKFILDASAENSTLGKVLKELQEPRPKGDECIPWLGEPVMKDRIVRLCARGKIAINVRGTDYLQREAGEEEEEAWKRLRNRVGYTGRQLEEVSLLTPSAVPATGGAVPTPTPSGGGGDSGNIPGTEGGSGESPGETPTPPLPVIFGTESATPTTALSTPATSPLNLIGKLEGWEIGPATPVRTVTLKVGGATGAQLKELLKNLPDGMRFELSLDREDG